jgi:hypothetical protein
MFEKTLPQPGQPSAFTTALTTAMKIPFLIFLVSGFATLQLEPVATLGVARGTKLLREFVKEQRLTQSTAGKFLQAGDSRINRIREELADVQLDLMKVLQTDHAVTARLESREAGLKYALRAEQVRQDEIAQCQRAGKRAVDRVLASFRCVVPASEKPQS